jgi:hypothetical protein
MERLEDRDICPMSGAVAPNTVGEVLADGAETAFHPRATVPKRALRGYHGLALALARAAIVEEASVM